MKNQIHLKVQKILRNNWNLDEVVFENRNKNFGAYFLRKNYNKVLLSIVLLQSILFFNLYLSFIFFKTNENINSLDDSIVGQVITPEMSITTVNIQEPSKQTEIKKEKLPQVSSGPNPLPTSEENSNGLDLSENKTTSSKFEPSTVMDDEIQPPLEETKENDLINKSNENIDFFENETSENKLQNVHEENLNKNVIVLKTKEDKEKFDKIKRRVKKVYPYVILAEIKLKELETKIASVSQNRDKKELTKKFEDELKNEFGKEISNLNLEEGKILMKLLNRNTGKSAYDILKNFRGIFVAGLAQGIAKIFGQDLKSEFNKTEDVMIETAVVMVEKGLY